VIAWFSRVDEGLVPQLELLLGFAAGAGEPAGRAKKKMPAKKRGKVVGR
jgi:hypothetical protein